MRARDCRGPFIPSKSGHHYNITDVSVFHGPKTSSVVVISRGVHISEVSLFTESSTVVVYSYVVVDLWNEEWFSREKKEEFVEELEQQ